MTSVDARHLHAVPALSLAPTLWDGPVALDDYITAMLALDVQQRQAAGLDVPDSLTDALAFMQYQVEDALVAMIDDAFGCADLLPGARPLRLTEAAFLGSADSDTLAVFLPGIYTTFEAVNAAMEALASSPVTASLVDPNDPNLVADVSRPRWLVLHECAGVHSFHPEIASDGSGTPGAILVTRVDLLTE